MKLPKVIYVKKEIDGDDEFFISSEHTRDLAEKDEPVIIGTYRLEQLNEVRMGVIVNEVVKDKK